MYNYKYTDDTMHTGYSEHNTLVRSPLTPPPPCQAVPPPAPARPQIPPRGGGRDVLILGDLLVFIIKVVSR